MIQLRFLRHTVILGGYIDPDSGGLSPQMVLDTQKALAVRVVEIGLMR